MLLGPTKWEHELHFLKDKRKGRKAISMVEYIITLIKNSKQDEMPVTLEARARLRNFNCACKFLSPVLHSSSVCLCTYFLPAHNIAVECYPFIFSSVAAATEKACTATSLAWYSGCAQLESRSNSNCPDWVYMDFLSPSIHIQAYYLR